MPAPALLPCGIATGAGQGHAFPPRIQNVDVLLVDDVQFLTNRKEMQAELLRLTEALQQAVRLLLIEVGERRAREVNDAAMCRMH
mgnify:CR=1 FL=1